MTRNKIKVDSKINLKSLRVYLLSGICGVLAVLSIFMTIQSASTGAEVAGIQNKESALLVQQRELETQLVENLSVNSLQEKSIEMGFTKVSNLVYVSGRIPVARLP
ncbi:MAG TPA: hypothetical protein VKC53_01215 [Patescibacteria group bacterium]|nr:hypothetical protein [Patescibacteria group bacterium]